MFTPERCASAIRDYWAICERPTGRSTDPRPAEWGSLTPMGDDVASRTFTREDRQRYRDKVHRCLDVFARMLAESRFDFDTPMTGMEVELNLIDAQGQPALRNSRGARPDRRPGLRAGARPVQPRDQRPPAQPRR